MHPRIIVGALVGLALVSAGCDVSSGTTTTLQVHIAGAGRVYSDSGDIDCTADAHGPSGSCSVQQFVGWNDNASSMAFHLHAVPASGSVFAAWDFSVSADCPGCASGDPEMGAIDPHGDEADVRIDMNPGYDVTDDVTAQFVPVQ